MNDNYFQHDLSRSAAAFIEVIWPAISQRWFGGGVVIPNESVVQATFARLLDVEAGVDHWIHRPGGITPVASRVQWIAPGCQPYNSFTIRTWRASGLDTELQKRRRAFEADGRFLSPQITLQAYLCRDTNRLRSVGGVYTKDLYRFWDHYPERTNGDGQSGFRTAFWTHLEKLGCRVRTWHEDEQEAA